MDPGQGQVAGDVFPGFQNDGADCSGCFSGEAETNVRQDVPEYQIGFGVRRAGYGKIQAFFNAARNGCLDGREHHPIGGLQGGAAVGQVFVFGIQADTGSGRGKRGRGAEGDAPPGFFGGKNGFLSTADHHKAVAGRPGHEGCGSFFIHGQGRPDLRGGGFVTFESCG